MATASQRAPQKSSAKVSKEAPQQVAANSEDAQLFAKA
jgi:hypothetical protein